MVLFPRARKALRQLFPVSARPAPARRPARARTVVVRHAPSTPRPSILPPRTALRPVPPVRRPAPQDLPPLPPRVPAPVAVADSEPVAPRQTAPARQARPQQPRQRPAGVKRDKGKLTLADLDTSVASPAIRAQLEAFIASQDQQTEEVSQ